MDNSAVKPIQLSGPVDCGNGKLQVWSFSEVAQTTFCNISGLPWTVAHLLLLGRLQTDSLNSGTSTWLGSSCCPQSHSQQLLGNYFVQKCIWSDVITCNISLLFIKHYETDRSLDFWWKHILTGRGRYDLGELLIGTVSIMSTTAILPMLDTFTCTLLFLLGTCWYFTVCSRHSQPAGRCCWSLIEANWATTQEEVSYIIIIPFHFSSFASKFASI